MDDLDISYGHLLEASCKSIIIWIHWCVRVLQVGNENVYAQF